MAPIVQSQQPVIDFGEPAVAFPAADKPSAASQTWGNTMPLALIAFAVTTLMLSLINAGLFNAATLPVVLGVGFAVGGVTQLIAGLLQFRIGDTFHGVLFSTFGAFWVALYVLGISLLVATLFVLAVGNYSASVTTVKAGGWLGIALAGVAFYLTLATVGQASYGREILWVGHLAKK